LSRTMLRANSLSPSSLSSETTHAEARVTQKPKRRKLPSLLAGAFAGATSKTVVAPLERVKLLLQLRSSLPLHQQQRQSLSAIQVAHDVYAKQGGILSFWRGNTPNVLRQAGTAGLNFALMEQYQDIARKTLRHYHPAAVSFLSGGLAGATATTLLYPLDFIRTRMAMDVGYESTRMYSSMTNVLKSSFRSNHAGMYRGYGISIAGVFVYRAMHLGGYQVLKKDQPPSLWRKLMLAQTVSLVAGTLCYPLDSIRRRLMMDNHHEFKNAWDCFHKIRINEGWRRGFYLGIGPNVVRSSLGGAILLVAYDVFKEP